MSKTGAGRLVLVQFTAFTPSMPTTKRVTMRPYKKRFVFLGLMLGLVLVVVGALVAARIFEEVQRAKSDMEKIRAAALAFKEKNGVLHLPLEKLAEQQPDDAPALLKESDLIDPWGNRYEFSSVPIPNGRYGPNTYGEPSPPLYKVSVISKGPLGHAPISLQVGNMRLMFTRQRQGAR
jgi:hypothetical protein